MLELQSHMQCNPLCVVIPLKQWTRVWLILLMALKSLVIRVARFL